MQNKVKLDHSHLYSEIRLNNFYTCLGKIDQIVGMTVEGLE